MKSNYHLLMNLMIRISNFLNLSVFVRALLILLILPLSLNLPHAKGHNSSLEKHELSSFDGFFDHQDFSGPEEFQAEKIFLVSDVAHSFVSVSFEHKINFRLNSTHVKLISFFFLDIPPPALRLIS